MQQPWTERGTKGAMYLAAGICLILGNETALALAHGNNLAMAVVNLLFGVIGPVLLLVGLYLVGTRHKQVKKQSKE